MEKEAETRRIKKCRNSRRGNCGTNYDNGLFLLSKVQSYRYSLFLEKISISLFRSKIGDSVVASNANFRKFAKNACWCHSPKPLRSSQNERAAQLKVVNQSVASDVF